MILQTIVVTVAVVMFNAWLFVIVEAVSVLCFAGWAYMHGKRVLYEPMPADIPHPLQVEWSGETASGKLVAHTPNLVLIRRKIKLFGFQNALPLKSVLRLHHGGMILDVRLPIGPLLFVMGWMLGWLAGSLCLIATDPAVFVLMAGGGLLFVGLMVVISLRIEKRRARTLAAEVIAQLSSMRT